MKGLDNTLNYFIIPKSENHLGPYCIRLNGDKFLMNIFDGDGQGMTIAKDLTRNNEFGSLGEKGQIMKIAMPMNASNVMILDPKTDKPSRIGKKQLGDKMIRIARKSNQEI